VAHPPSDKWNAVRLCSLLTFIFNRNKLPAYTRIVINLQFSLVWLHRLHDFKKTRHPEFSPECPNRQVGRYLPFQQQQCVGHWDVPYKDTLNTQKTLPYGQNTCVIRVPSIKRANPEATFIQSTVYKYKKNLWHRLLIIAAVAPKRCLSIFRRPESIDVFQYGIT